MGILSKLERMYNDKSDSQKNLILMVVFFIILMLLLEMFFFNSYNDSLNSQEKIVEMEKEAVVYKEENLVLSNNISKNSKESLLKQKHALEAELNKIVEKNGSFVNVENLLGTIKGVIDNFGSLNLNEFRSLGSKVDDRVNLFKIHTFEIKVSGQYQSIYDFVLYLNNLKFIKIEELVIERMDKVLTGKITLSIRNQKDGFIGMSEKLNEKVIDVKSSKETGEKK